MDEDLGLSDRAKELKKWNKPYRYQEFPKMLYRGTTTAGRLGLEERVVDSEGEEQAAAAAGWLANPELAGARETRRQEAVGVAAAERAYQDQRMTRAARAEAEAAEAEASGHLPEIPAAKRKR